MNLDNICSDQNKSNRAKNFYIEQWDNRFNIKECPYPCKFTRVHMGSKSNYEEPKRKMKFVFNRFIKTTKARYVYRELEFLAEFGGYVGLFLGVSVNQITMLMDIAFGWFDTFCNSKHLN